MRTHAGTGYQREKEKCRIKTPEEPGARTDLSNSETGVQKIQAAFLSARVELLITRDYPKLKLVVVISFERNEHHAGIRTKRFLLAMQRSSEKPLIEIGGVVL